MHSRHLFFSVLATVGYLGALQGTECLPVSTGNIVTTVSASERLNMLMDAYFCDIQRASPEFATHVGATRAYNGRWTEHTEEAYTKQCELIEKYLGLLGEIDPEGLSQSDRINYHLLEKNCRESLEGHAYGMYVMPLDHLGGIPLDIEHTLQSMPCHDKQDYENVISRLKGIPLLIDQTITLLEKGLERDITPPQIILRNLPNSILKMIPDDIESSIFYASFKHFPESDGQPLGLGQEDQDYFRNAACDIIRNQIYPAYQKLHSYLVTAYIPNCRKTVGASDLPNGRAWYGYCVRQQTTTNMTPEEIHEIGLGEVKRIHQEMRDILADSGFKGTLADYFSYLNTSSEFYYEDAESLLTGYRDILKHIDVQLVNLFGRLPKLPYEVVPMPSHIQEGQIGAYYMRGSLATGRPGRFYVNTYDLSRRPKWQMESLALHEAVPGHHFQISIAQEIEGLPQFRKYTGYTAYIEGWGLYSESLGSEFGLYSTPSTKVGRLIEEVWRAVRLVVDTGMHALGWTREQAIDYFVEQTGMNEHEATTEIDRYIVWPAQALAYKIGELSIKRWRQEARETLGEAFDIRAFHDALLELGALPLDVCDAQMRAWMQK